MKTKVEEVKELIRKASETEDSGDAMRFAQAALNGANALCVLESMQRELIAPNEED